jgi:hypothetical protein
LFTSAECTVYLTTAGVSVVDQKETYHNSIALPHVFFLVLHIVQLRDGIPSHAVCHHAPVYSNVGGLVIRRLGGGLAAGKLVLQSNPS